MRNTSTIYSHYNLQALNWEYAIEKQDSLYPVTYRPHLLTDSIISVTPVNYFKPKIEAKSTDELLGPLVYAVVFLIIFAFIRLRGKDLITTLLQVTVNRKKTELILNEGITQNLTCYILALFLSFSALSIGIAYFISGDFNPQYAFWLFCGLTTYHFLELFLIRIFGWTFKATHTADEAIVNLWTFHIMTGLLVSPLVIAIFFVKAFSAVTLVKIITFCLILLLTVKFIRWLQILFAHRVSILYIILYLCALEVMPLLILYKLTE